MDELLHVHVRYELDMLFGTFEQLQHPVPNLFIGNALVESFCMHARPYLNAQGQGVVRHGAATSIEFLLLDEFGIFPRIIGLDHSKLPSEWWHRMVPSRVAIA